MYSTPTWACAKPDCNHYMPPHIESSINGKYTICWECGATTTMNVLSMKDNNPKCDECRGNVIPDNFVAPPPSGLLKDVLEGKPMDENTRRRLEMYKGLTRGNQ